MRVTSKSHIKISCVDHPFCVRLLSTEHGEELPPDGYAGSAAPRDLRAHLRGGGAVVAHSLLRQG